MCISEVVAISASNPDSSLWVFQSAFCMMNPACRLNQQSNSIQPGHTPSPILNQSVVPCSIPAIVSWLTNRFLRRHMKVSYADFLKKKLIKSDIWYSYWKTFINVFNLCNKFSTADFMKFKYILATSDDTIFKLRHAVSVHGRLILKLMWKRNVKYAIGNFILIT